MKISIQPDSLSHSKQTLEHECHDEWPLPLRARTSRAINRNAVAVPAVNFSKSITRT